MREVRIGKVSRVNYEKGTIDVILEDEEEAVRHDLPLFSDEYRMPKVDEMVTVIFKTNSGKREEGYVIGVPFQKENVPEYTGKDVYYKRLSKEAFVHFDPETGVLKIHAPRVIIEEG